MSRKPLRRSHAARRNANATLNAKSRSVAGASESLRLYATGGGLGFRTSFGNELNQAQRAHSISRAFSKASHTYQKDAVVQEMMAQELIKLMKESPLLDKCHFNRVLEVGCGSGKLTRHLINQYAPQELCLNDLSQSMLETAREHIPAATGMRVLTSSNQHEISSPDEPVDSKGDFILLEPQASLPTDKTVSISELDTSLTKSLNTKIKLEFVLGDILEKSSSDFTKPFDLIVSNAVMQWMPDFKEALEHFRTLSLHHSKWFKLPEAGKYDVKIVGNYQDGEPVQLEGTLPSALCFASLSRGTFIEIKKLLGVSLDYMDVDRISEGLGEICSDFDVKFTTYRQYFSSARAMLRHLKDTGVNALSHENMSVSQMRAFMQSYEKFYSDKNGVYLTWCPYYVIARF